MKRNWFWGIICILGAILILETYLELFNLTLVYGKLLELLSVYPLLSTESKKEASTAPYLGLRLFSFYSKKI